MPPKPRPIADRLWPKIDRRGPDECWPWTASVRFGGYGQIAGGSRGGGMKPAHRVAYELLVGPIPEGLVIDHLCRNRRCCNPAHLEPVSNTTNLMRGTGVSARNAVKASCLHGHPFSEDNTFRTSKGGRGCVECRRRRNSRFAERQRRFGPNRSKAS